MRKINIRYSLTNRCNYNCEYCINAESRSKQSYEPTRKDIDALLKNTDNFLVDTFSLYGGEPTISPNLYYIVEQLYNKSNIHKIKIFTNGSNIKAIEKLEKFNDKIAIMCSMHFDKYSDSLLENNIKMLNTYKQRYNLSIIFDKKYEDILKDFSKYYFKYFKNNSMLSFVYDNSENINFLFGKIDEKYKECSDLNFLKEICSVYGVKYTQFINDRYTNPFYNKICSLNYYIVMIDGFIKGGSCFKFEKKYNLYEKNTELPLMSKKCTNLFVKYDNKCFLNHV